MRIHCFQHVSFESPGTIVEWAISNNHYISYTHFYEEGFSLPELANIDVLLILGGYMNVDEESKYPWLKVEKAYIKQAIVKGKKVIGICLGSQLISSVLGAKVYSGITKEIGFFPLNFAEEALFLPLFSHFKNPYTLFHWHGDTFDLPLGAQLIASSQTCKNQAYVINDNVLALQFHLEMNEQIIEQLLSHAGKELYEKGDYIQNIDTIRDNFLHLEQNRVDLFLLLNKFLSNEL